MPSKVALKEVNHFITFSIVSGHCMCDENQNYTSESKQPILLCIDDDLEIGESIKLRLSEFEVEVVLCFHGMHGFHEAMNRKPDLIITDMRMPQGEGNVVVECVRNNPDTQQIPIIILTGQRDRPLEAQMRCLGVQDYLNKPIKFDELREAITKYIPLRRRPEVVLEQM